MTNLKQGLNKSFSTYRNSPDGIFEQEIIWKHLRPELKLQGQEQILDLACGEAWLSQKLLTLSPNIYACDISPELISLAKTKNPKLHLETADITKDLPYKDNFFDCVIWNLGAHDVMELLPVVKNLYRILKPEGQLFLTITNPYYSFPVGQWKRGLKKLLPNSQPELTLRPYNQFKKNRAFLWGSGFEAYFHTLPECINPCLTSGFTLSKFNEIISETDTKKFTREHQLYRFPMMLLLEFKKVLK